VRSLVLELDTSIWPQDSHGGDDVCSARFLGNNETCADINGGNISGLATLRYEFENDLFTDRRAAFPLDLIGCSWQEYEDGWV